MSDVNGFRGQTGLTKGKLLHLILFINKELLHDFCYYYAQTKKRAWEQGNRHTGEIGDRGKKGIKEEERQDETGSTGNKLEETGRHRNVTEC